MTLEKNNTVTQREHPAFEDDYIAPHRRPSDVSDRLAFAFVKALRFVADRFFAGRYGHRAVVLETVAAVPGMVGGLLQHLKALRYIRDDRGWIKELLDEAENERMHLMTFVEIARPTILERVVIMLTEPLPIASGPKWGRIEKPGLGVEVDEDKLARFHEAFVRDGQYMMPEFRGR